MSLEYALVDLDKVRDAGLIDDAIRQHREQVNRDRVTSFTWLTLHEVAAAGALIEASFTSTGWMAVMRGRGEVAWSKRTSDWLCHECVERDERPVYPQVREGLCGWHWLERWKAAQEAAA